MDNNKTGEVSFQKELEKGAVNRVRLLIFISAVLFLLGITLVDVISSQLIAWNHLNEMQDSFEDIEDDTIAFLQNDLTSEVLTDIFITSKENTEASEIESTDTEEPTNQEEPFDMDASLERFHTMYEHFDSGMDISSNYLLVDSDWNIMESTYDNSNITTYFSGYVNAVGFRAGESEKEVYRSVYFNSGEYADTLYFRTIYDEDKEPVGRLVLILSGSSWNYLLSETDYDGVITDERNNVLYSSRYIFINRVNKMRNEDAAFVMKTNHGDYWKMARVLEDRNITLYAYVHIDIRGNLIAGLLVGILAAVLWRMMASYISREMAILNSNRIDTLVKEIRYIRKKDQTHRIHMETEDEFSEVGTQINRMLDSIDELNQKNTELLVLNNKAEISELTSQMNPHFLYNTLETIRNLVIFDGPKASELIERLTELLRYSISYSQREVNFRQDLQATDQYVQIQKTRFGDRLNCEIDISEECMDLIVPKFLIQPIIENSIKYGFKNKVSLNVSVKGWKEGESLMIRVTDDGGGMDAAEAESLRIQLEEHKNESDSLGLRNLSRRLYLRYGKRSGIWINNMEGEGFEVNLRIDY